MMLFIKLILAHLLGDFIFQPKRWVAAKEKRRLMAPQLYVHVLLHGILILLLVFDLSFWRWALFLMLAHGAIDVVKLYWQNEQTKRVWFFVDQLIHIVIILATVAYLEIENLGNWQLWSEKEWLILTLLVFLTIPASVITKTLISKWTPLPDLGSDSLDQAGKYIGILERLFVFAFIVAGRFEAIGFLVAAKSVFRFGDLRQSKDRKLTEYILIGTLLSFGLAILCGLIFTYFI